MKWVSGINSHVSIILFLFSISVFFYFINFCFHMFIMCKWHDQNIYGFIGAGKWPIAVVIALCLTSYYLAHKLWIDWNKAYCQLLWRLTCAWFPLISNSCQMFFFLSGFNFLVLKYLKIGVVEFISFETSLIFYVSCI